MAEKFSTGLRDSLLGEDGLRRLMADFVLDVYSGSPPATADAAATGTKLCRVTKASGTVSATELSIAAQSYLNITKIDAGSTLALNLNSEGAVTYTAGSGADLATRVAVIAAAFEAANPVMRAMAVAATSGTGSIVFQSKIPGLTYTLTVAGSGAGTIGAAATHDGMVDKSVIGNTRSDALQLGTPASGVISKETGQTWSGTNLVTGTAGYFRMVLPDDTAAESTTAIRIQGSVGTGGAELNLSSLSFTVDAVTTISGGDITLPAS